MTVIKEMLFLMVKLLIARPKGLTIFYELLPEKSDYSKFMFNNTSEVFCPVSFSPSTIAGIASSILLFVAAIATMVCCFMCSCCYLYQRRQQRGRTPYEGKHNHFFLFAVHPEFTTCGILLKYIYM